MIEHDDTIEEANPEIQKQRSGKDAPSTPDSFRFFANRACKYYPCHAGIEEINCLFCYCPLYPFMDCGGDYTLTKTGIKNCTNCIRPHKAENYDLIMTELKKRLSAANGGKRQNRRNEKESEGKESNNGTR